MKYFATGFFLKKGTTAKEVINECLSWVSNSPHTKLIPAQIDFMRNNCDEFELEGENEKIELTKHSENSLSMYCFRYSKITMPHKWITDISINEYINEGSLWVQVQSNVLTQDAAYKSPNTKRPLIVMNLLDKFSGGDDDIFNVGIEPIYLKDTQEDIEKATSIINSSTKNRLPIVYVSSRYYYREHAYNLIPTRLARKLSGLAHVVIEPTSIIFSNKLKFKVNGKNVYGGAVGIYWPNGQEISVHKRGLLNAGDFEDLIFDEVIKATTSLVPLKKGGWIEINNAKNRKSIQVLKEQGSSSDQLLSLYEEENSTLHDEVRDLNSKVEMLEYRIKKLLEKTPAQGDLYLNTGDEDDFFEGEISEYLILTLEKSLPSIRNDSRHHHIINEIIKNNPHKDKLKELEGKLKKALNGYREMNKKVSSLLIELGFSICEEGKHYKLTYQEDSRYTYVLSKTGSDHRGCLNAISDISNKMFI
ncbi:TPA: hypothetical protein ACRRWQ_000819 [Morganella morganii]